MLTQTRTLSSRLDDVGRWIIKMTRYTKKDTVEARQVSPYGLDSNPIPGLVAIYGHTESVKDCVVVGYILPRQLAALGEIRLYSTDQDGNIKSFVWLKNDGTMNLNGSAKHLARFEELETAFNQLKSDFNGHTHAGVTPGGGTTATPLPQSAADISGAKAETIKTL